MSSKREATKDFLHLKHYTMMVFIFIGAVMVNLAYDNGLPYALFMIDFEIVSGTVTEFEMRHGSHNLSYSFSDQNGDEYSKTKLVGSNFVFRTLVGNSIDVTFFPIYPEISMATSLVRFLKPDFWVMIVGSALILLASIVSIFSILQIIKHYKDDRYY